MTIKSEFSELLEKVASPNTSDLDIWTAVAQLLVAFDSPRVPSTPPPKDNNTNIEAKSPIRKLHENWTSDYLPESLEALQHMIRVNESRRDSAEVFYAKTLIFVQSSGMGKSRLADAFGKECPMVNFVLREEGTLGYPPPDGEVLSFMRARLPERYRERIIVTLTKAGLSSRRILEEEMEKIKNSSSGKKLKSMTAKSSRPKEGMKASLEPEEEDKPSEINDETFLESMSTTVWNHSLAVGLLQASFEICKLRSLFITTKA
jgi:hypothetical protein